MHPCGPLEPRHVVRRKVFLDEVLHQRDVPAALQVVSVPVVMDVHPLDRAGRLTVPDRALDFGVVPAQAVPHLGKLCRRQVITQDHEPIAVEVLFQFLEVQVRHVYSVPPRDSRRS